MWNIKSKGCSLIKHVKVMIISHISGKLRNEFVRPALIIVVNLFKV